MIDHVKASVAPSSAREEESDLPEVEWITMTKVAKGWIVLRCVSQGRKILDEEALMSAPGTRDMAANVLRVETARRFLIPRDVA